MVVFSYCRTYSQIFALKKKKYDKAEQNNWFLKISIAIPCRCSFNYDLSFKGNAFQSGVRFTAVNNNKSFPRFAFPFASLSQV